MLDGRQWADGGNKSRRHEIEVVSYRLGVMVCAVDGEVVRFGDVPSDVAWDIHRGVTGKATQRVASRALLATDDEVAEFLRRVEAGEDAAVPDYRPIGAVVIDEAGSQPMSDFLDIVRELQDRCTCDTNSSILECPNYVDGDEMEYDE